jgi:hypothetical protein
MKPFQITLIAVVVAATSLSAQRPDLKSTLLGIYTPTLVAMQHAKTADDIERAIDAIDAPDWISIDADGTRMTREEAKKQLVASLTGQRGAQPTIELLWVNQSAISATAVAWVFGRSQNVDSAGEYGAKETRHDVLVGALARDSWALTTYGWRRRMHEKIFPNRVIADFVTAMSRREREAFEALLLFKGQNGTTVLPLNENLRSVIRISTSII